MRRNALVRGRSHHLGTGRRRGGEGQVKGGGLAEQNRQNIEADPEREERRRVRRRRKLRLKAALLGRSRGGQTSKVHLRRRPQVLPAGLRPDCGPGRGQPAVHPGAGEIRARGPVGRPRTRPDAVARDEACSSRGNRAHLRKRHIKAVIPEKSDQAANRRKKGPRGGRPVGHDACLYKERTTVERLINKLKACRGIATRHDKTPGCYLAGLHLRASMIWVKDLTRDSS